MKPWPEGRIDRAGFRGPWRLRNGYWERRCHPALAEKLSARDGRDCIYAIDGLGNRVDAWVIVTSVVYA